MTRHRRNNFSSATKREAYERSKDENGVARCECHRIPGWTGCGVALVTGSIFYEHINTDYHSGDNSLSNCATLTKTCWRKKTSTSDIPKIAKTKRVRDIAIGIDRKTSRPLPGSHRSGIKLQFNGPPIDRATGQPWRWR